MAWSDLLLKMHLGLIESWFGLTSFSIMAKGPELIDFGRIHSDRPGNFIDAPWIYLGED